MNARRRVAAVAEAIAVAVGIGLVALFWLMAAAVGLVLAVLLAIPMLLLGETWS